MPKNKWTGGRITGAIANSIFMILLVLFVLNVFFDWGFNDIFLAIALMVASLWMISQGGIKVLKSMRLAGKVTFAKFIHVLSFAFGILGLYIAVTILPVVGGVLLIHAIANLTASIMIAFAVLFGIEIFV